MNQNQVKKISSLSQAKHRKKHGLFLAEGIHIVEELLKSNWDAQILIITHKAAESEDFAAILETASRRKIDIETVTQKAISRLSTTESPQGIMAVAKLPADDIKHLVAQERILIADGVSDPGNLGTMIRTAVAFGFGGFISTPGAADIFNPKTVRATQGALFHLAVANHLDQDEIAKKIKPSHRIYALSAQGQSDLQAVRPASKFVLVVGAEISGVSKRLLDMSDLILRIPMPGPVESLNAAMASGIAMYEFARRG